LHGRGGDYTDPRYAALATANKDGWPFDGPQRTYAAYGTSTAYSDGGALSPDVPLVGASGLHASQQYRFVSQNSSVDAAHFTSPGTSAYYGLQSYAQSSDMNASGSKPPPSLEPFSINTAMWSPILYQPVPQPSEQPSDYDVVPQTSRNGHLEPEEGRR